MLPPTLRDGFVADHRELEGFLERIGAASRAHDEAATGSLWASFMARLETHLEVEEQHLIPALDRGSARSARVLRSEHKYLRSCAHAIEASLASSTASEALFDRFRDVLVAHARVEEHLLYSWADLHAEPEVRRIVLTALVECSGRSS